MQQVEFFVFVAHFFGFAIAVEGFSLEAEDGLGVDVARFGDAAAGRVALGDEDGGVVAAFVVAVVMHTAIAEFFVVEAYLFDAFFRLLFDVGKFFTVFFGLHYLTQQGIRRVGVHVEEVVEMFLDDVVDIIPDGYAVGFHVLGTQLGFGLRFENGLLHLDADSRGDGFADVARLKVFFIELADGLHDGFAKGLLVGAALGGVLSVDEGVIFFGIFGSAVGDGTFEAVFFDMDDGIHGFAIYIIVQQIEQAVFG